MPDSNIKWLWLAITVVAVIAIFGTSTAQANNTELAVREPFVFEITTSNSQDIDDLEDRFYTVDNKLDRIICYLEPTECL